MSVFRERLKAARRLRGLKQYELAAMVEVEPTVISRYETGLVKEASMSRLIKLCDALDVSADFLLGRTDNMTLR